MFFTTVNIFCILVDPDQDVVSSYTAEEITVETTGIQFNFVQTHEKELMTNFNLESESVEDLTDDDQPLPEEDFDLQCDPLEDLHITNEEEHSLDQDAEDNDVDSDPLYPGAAVTLGAFMLLLAIFTTKYNLIGEATEQLLKILALALPHGHKLCASLYEFKLFFKNLRNPLVRHYYCNYCLGYIENTTVQSCPYEFCKSKFSVKNASYFIEMPLEHQIQNLFAQKDFYESLGHRFKRKSCDNTYEDIYDGKLYKQLSENNGILSFQENISFTFNTDGAPVFKSSKTAIWPIYLVINELPYKQRMLKDNMILASLWYGSKKPSMGTFLKPFLKSLQKMKEGIKCTSPERGQFLCRGLLLCGTADLPARSLLCNHVQYNGAFSCWKCEQEGETASVGRGHARIFPFQSEEPKGPIRTKKNVLENARIAVEDQHIVMGKPVKGIKGPSWLFFVPNFNIVSGIAIDYMHGVLLGVQKMLLELWFSEKHKGKAYNFCNSVCEVDLRLQNIKPTLDITRLPRSIEKDLKYWKASEYRSFLLFFGAPVLHGILDMQRFSHFLLLVDSMHILLKFGSNEKDLERAEMLLFEFCRRLEELYDRCFLRLNVHQLLHLPDCVRDLGPLYTHSCFSFESKNGIILKMIRGSQSIDTQIITAISFIQKLPELKQKCVAENSEVDKLCKAIQEPSLLKRGQKLGKGIYILGAPCNRVLKNVETAALQDYLKHDPACDTYRSFNRVEYGSYIIYGTEYSRMIKRNNSAICYNGKNDISFGEVMFFILFEDNTAGMTKPLVFIKKLLCRNYNVNSNILAVTGTNDVEVVNINDILSSCMLVSFPGGQTLFICKFPNRLESD
ncbi:uncharacterized protein LOC134229281 isoform X2 [Saccostrea cucullata]|uniref:uncharacterized protein LOC134229281 isoform X2 n=1 Tax=Saccostrea cuccullata TaxID=36930 RepID=UPI002ED206B4